MTLRVTPAAIVAAAESTGAPGLLAVAPDWSRVRLGDVAQVVNGAAFSSQHFNALGTGMPLIRIRDVKSSSTNTWYDGPWEATHLVEPGSLLVGMDGDFNAATWHGPVALLNQRVCRIDVDEQRYDRRFLEYALQGYLDAIWKATSSTTVKHLSSRSVSDIPLPNPTRDQQRRIVEILEDHFSRLDAANGYLDAAQRRLDSLRRSILRETIEGSSDRVALGHLISKVQAGRSFGRSAPPARPDEWGVIKVSAMTWGEFRQGENKAVPADHADRRFEIKQGDLLVSRANTSAYVGASVLVGETRPRLLLSDKSLRLFPHRGVDPEWLHLALSAPSVRQQISDRATGTKESMRNISQASLLSVAVPKVSLDEQLAQVKQVRVAQSAIHRLSAEVRASSIRSRTARRSLLAAAFSGRLTGGSSDLERAEELAST